MVPTDNPNAFARLREITLWRELTLARLEGLRGGLLQTSRETRSATEGLVNELHSLLQVAVGAEWERRRSDLAREGAGAVAVAPTPHAAEAPMPVAERASGAIVTLRPTTARPEPHQDGSGQVGAANSVVRLLARNPARDREAMFRALVGLYCARRGGLEHGRRRQLGDLLRRMLPLVSEATRRALAERIATVPDANTALILALAADTIDVARPVLEKAALLEDDLIDLIARTTPDHARAIAGRRGLGQRVLRAIAEARLEERQEGDALAEPGRRPA